eukprot:scaffold8624_cov110-Isochrysis_galbana.AAC.7
MHVLFMRPCACLLSCKSAGGRSRRRRGPSWRQMPCSSAHLLPQLSRLCGQRCRGILCQPVLTPVAYRPFLVPFWHEGDVGSVRVVGRLEQLCYRCWARNCDAHRSSGRGHHPGAPGLRTLR